jgi:hypothetical protein
MAMSAWYGDQRSVRAVTKSRAPPGSVITLSSKGIEMIRECRERISLRMVVPLLPVPPMKMGTMVLLSISFLTCFDESSLEKGEL